MHLLGQVFLGDLFGGELALEPPRQRAPGHAVVWIEVAHGLPRPQGDLILADGAGQQAHATPHLAGRCPRAQGRQLPPGVDGAGGIPLGLAHQGQHLEAARVGRRMRMGLLHQLGGQFDVPGPQRVPRPAHEGGMPGGRPDVGGLVQDHARPRGGVFRVHPRQRLPETLRGFGRRGPQAQRLIVVCLRPGRVPQVLVGPRQLQGEASVHLAAVAFSLEDRLLERQRLGSGVGGLTLLGKRERGALEVVAPVLGQLADDLLVLDVLDQRVGDLHLGSVLGGVFLGAHPGGRHRHRTGRRSLAACSELGLVGLHLDGDAGHIVVDGVHLDGVVGLALGLLGRLALAHAAQERFDLRMRDRRGLVLELVVGAWPQGRALGLEPAPAQAVHVEFGSVAPGLFRVRHQIPSSLRSRT